MDKITIRPSSLVTYLSCQYQWYNIFILKKRAIPNARAAIGTGIHAGAEVMWNEAIKTGDKSSPNIDMMTQAAIDAYDNQIKEADGLMQFDDGLDDNSARSTVKEGTEAFVNDIVPFTKIPLEVEKKVVFKLDHCIVADVSGTIDYITDDTIADIKTSKRKVVPNRYVLQQSMYKYLANANGYNIKHNVIQGVVLSKNKTAGGIDKLDANIEQVKTITNVLLGKLDTLYKDIVDPRELFSGNPTHYLCSDKYCSLRKTCPFVHGDIELTANKG